MAFINFFAEETGTHALFNIWNIVYHFVFSVGLFLLHHLVLLCNSRILLIGTGLFMLLLLPLLDELLLHGASSGVWYWGNWFSFWLDTFDMMLHVCCPICCIWSLGQQRWSNYIPQHMLPIQFHFKWFPFFHDFVNPLAEVLWFEMCSSFRTLIFLPSIIVSIDTLVIIEINIFFNISVIFSLLLFLLDIILIIIFIRKLIQIILVVVVGVLLLMLTVLPRWNLFGVHASVLATCMLLESLAIHFFLCFL